ncbi:hypothetical protein AB0O34_00410 [Sphaerisporangium sp. NPDC088356]|uniref:hypothetical protein n=1 Tax=Sphaerisporangium sp. NPDC088356 TaxID=3154871 RepID=UPI0034182E11
MIIWAVDDEPRTTWVGGASGERHACPPYEIRVFSVDGMPTWCEIAVLVRRRGGGWCG